MASPYKATRTVSMAFPPEGECVEPGCEWDSGPSRGSLTRIREHVAQTGHSVRAVHTTRSIYRATQRPARKKVTSNG